MTLNELSDLLYATGLCVTDAETMYSPESLVMALRRKAVGLQAQADALKDEADEKTRAAQANTDLLGDVRPDAPIRDEHGAKLYPGRKQ